MGVFFHALICARNTGAADVRVAFRPQVARPPECQPSTATALVISRVGARPSVNSFLFSGSGLCALTRQKRSRRLERCRCLTLERIASELHETGADGRSNVCCSQGRTHAPDQRPTFPPQTALPESRPARRSSRSLECHDATEAKCSRGRTVPARVKLLVASFMQPEAVYLMLPNAFERWNHVRG